MWVIKQGGPPSSASFSPYFHHSPPPTPKYSNHVIIRHWYNALRSIPWNFANTRNFPLIKPRLNTKRLSKPALICPWPIPHSNNSNHDDVNLCRLLPIMNKLHPPCCVFIKCVIRIYKNVTRRRHNCCVDGAIRIWTWMIHNFGQPGSILPIQYTNMSTRWIRILQIGSRRI